MSQPNPRANNLGCLLLFDVRANIFDADVACEPPAGDRLAYPCRRRRATRCIGNQVVAERGEWGNLDSGAIWTAVSQLRHRAAKWTQLASSSKPDIEDRYVGYSHFKFCRNNVYMRFPQRKSGTTRCGLPNGVNIDLCGNPCRQLIRC
jgi:hypothetical protein